MRDLVVTLKKVVDRIKVLWVDENNNPVGTASNPVNTTGDFVVEVDGDLYVESIARIQDSDGNDLNSTSGSLDVNVTNQLTDYATEATLEDVKTAAESIDTKVDNLSLESTQEDVLENLEALNSLVPTKYDYISLSYTSENLTGVVFKLGGSGGTTVSTLTLAYDVDDNLTTVTKS